MPKLSLELLVEVGQLLFFAVGTSLLSTLGVRIELLALDAVTAGQLRLGLWLGLLGGIAFYFGLYAMGLTELFPRFRLFLTRLRE